jgi:hypothetical protein
VVLGTGYAVTARHPVNYLHYLPELGGWISFDVFVLITATDGGDVTFIR